MAFGNVIGSNIFNILFILGVTATISPVAFIMENVVDSILLVLVSILVWVFAWSRLHIEKKRRCGAACMLCRISDIYLYEIRKIMYKMKKVFIEEIQGKEYNSVLTV